MQIQEDQLAQMSRLKKEESYRQMLSELRQSLPTATAYHDDPSLLAIIEQAVEKARAHGVESSIAITTFVKIAVIAGLSFDEAPDVRKYFDMPELEPDYKVTLLGTLVSKNLNEAI